MKRKQFTETQIIAALKQYEGGRSAGKRMNELGKPFTAYKNQEKKSADFTSHILTY